MDLIQYIEVDTQAAAFEGEVVTQLEIEEMIERDLALQASVKESKRRRDKMKPKFLAYLEEHAVPDQKGSRKMEFVAGKVESIVRESAKLNEDRAVEFCRGRGLDDCWKEVTVRVIKPEEFEDAVKSGVISREELRGLVDIKSNVALYVKPR